ncbi:hypothetical protein [Nonomuraea dietziae]|uniref:hypothetical protein n=1 Tax=Nonomuraea dietziae TaxID=65515 RepID=UPI00340A78EA
MIAMRRVAGWRALLRWGQTHWKASTGARVARHRSGAQTWGWWVPMVGQFHERGAHREP